MGHFIHNVAERRGQDPDGQRINGDALFRETRLDHAAFRNEQGVQ